ncbi:MAG: RluA family pseudouridine synthase [Candidatus Omnitrophica bacterium]|nr:RluA family pseudouridine synthase [Candidatus Omnitrophota bacterium]MBU1128796.1 RluA family pseudouridine synthase [Candidatus Omnitrophota bacterium]MBU1784348.1 RluA family pseudouridine synthase [Candidatus Omnitrophota bacterium]MBU1851211.1 RluA family pseudouridine synthase [Candidatus Omnitrophota bacterium]
MTELEFEVSADATGGRVDKCIALRLGEGYSRTFAKTLIDRGHVLVNGRGVKPRYIISSGDLIHVSVPPASENDMKPEEIPLEILYEDDWIIVINKHAGMIVHPGAGNRRGTLVNALLHHTKSLADTGNELRPGIVHRLDKDTSGVLVAAKNDKALRSLSGQFKKRAVKKTYIAIVGGRVEADNGVVDEPIARGVIDRKKMVIDHERGRPSRSIYHVLKRFKEFTVLRVELETGRTHQIRVHMRHIGHPVLGDATYGKEGGMVRQALHAEMIGFTHPETGEYVEFHSPVPDDIMEKIRSGKVVKGES